MKLNHDVESRIVDAMHLQMEKLNISQAQLAKETGLSANTVSKQLSGKVANKYFPRSTKKMCDALGMEVVIKFHK